VELVDDDDPQLLEQLEPLGVVGQDRRVEHVRVRDDDLARLAHGRPDRRRRVAVVGRGRDRQIGRSRQLGKFGDLVLSEGLGWKEEQRTRRRILGEGLEHRHRVAQRLAGRRGCHDRDVLSGMDRLECLGLVDVRSLDAAPPEPLDDPPIEPVREVRPFRVARRDDLVVQNTACE
jgi:hypothetical protein